MIRRLPQAVENKQKKLKQRKRNFITFSI